jgi:hypothetical protein
MAYYDQVFYCNAGDQSTTGYYAVAKWAATTAIAAGALRRQLAVPTVNNERVFICIVAGTTGGSEPAWTLTRGGKTTDSTVTWQEVTGIAAVNGDAANTVNWTAAKAIGTPTLGTIIKRNNGASYWICSTAGTMGASEPAWPNDTAGTTQADGTTTWTCLGVVGNFTGGQAPHARLANACASTWWVAGNTIYVGDNHAESQATAITINPAGTAATIGKILCHNHSGSYPPAAGDLMAGATVSTTGDVTTTFSPSGSFYIFGLTFKAGVGIAGSSGAYIVLAPQASGNTQNWAYFDNCSFWLALTSAGGAFMQIGNFPGSTFVNFIFNNTTVKFGNANQWITTCFCQFVWRNTGQVLASGSSVPTTLFNSHGSGGNTNDVILEALNLSQLTGSLFSSTNAAVGSLLIKDCNLNASATVTTPTATGMTVQLVRSDSGATAYKSARYTYEGTETTETSITRVGGASDPTGQAQSRKIVTTANSQWLRPFRAEPYAIWNPTMGVTVTVTVRGTINAGSLPNNDDIWLEVEYLGDSGGLFATWESFSATNVTLSGGNIVATNTGTTSADQGAHVAASFGQTSGKFYFEATYTTVTGGANCGVGVGTVASTYTNMGGSATVGAMTYRQTGNIYSNGTNTGSSLSVSVAGTTICVAVDLVNQQIWFCKAGGLWNNSGAANPATNVGGIALPAGAMVPFAIFGGTSGAAGNVVTVNFGASSFSGTVPSGFTAGWAKSTASPLGTIVTTTKATVLAANTAVASDSSTWNNLPNTTFNPADKEGHITLSGGNLTALGTAGWTGICRAVDGVSSGKFYFEFTFNATQASSGVGVAIGTLPVTTTFGDVVVGYCGVVRSGLVYVDGGTTYTVGGVAGSNINFGTISSGTVICVVIDVPNKLMWIRLGAAGNWNNNASRNPATGVGGVSIPNVTTAFPTVCFGGADTLIANFGSSAFTGSVPSGFTAGFPATFTPFKLTATLSAPQPGMAGYLHARVRAAKPSSTFYIDPQITLS